MNIVAKGVLLGIAFVTFSAPAFAQEGYVYGPRDRYQDDLSRPTELDGLALGREAPIISGRDGNIGTRSDGTFELQAPPIGDRLLRIR